MKNDCKGMIITRCPRQQKPMKDLSRIRQL
nr:MAG TPA: hypothetical protein [Caudoviricetes sp.]